MSGGGGAQLHPHAGPHGLSWYLNVLESGFLAFLGWGAGQWGAPPPLPAPTLTFIMFPIWLLPSDNTCSLTSASSESILLMRLLNRLRSSRLTSVSSPSMASMLLKDRSGGRAWLRGTVLELTPHLGSTVSFLVSEAGKGSHLCGPRSGMETHWEWVSASRGGGHT